MTTSSRLSLSFSSSLSLSVSLSVCLSVSLSLSSFFFLFFLSFYSSSLALHYPWREIQVVLLECCYNKLLLLFLRKSGPD